MRRAPVPVVLLTLAAVGGAGGCTPWPEYATGGIAERRPPESMALAALQSRYDALVAAGGMRLAGGRMTEASLALVRARREHAAGLHADSERSAAHASGLIVSLERDIRPGRVAARPQPGG